MSDVFLPDALREVEAVLTRRIDMLERDNAAFRARHRMIMWALGALLLITVLLTVLTMPQAARVEETLQANQFVLRDGTGLIRGIWEMDPQGGPRFVMRDGDGRERVRVSLLSDGSPGVTLGDREGRPRAVLGVLPDGTSNLVFADPRGTARAVFGHSSADVTSLVLADREGYYRAVLVVDEQGEGALTLYESGESAPEAEDAAVAPQP